MLFRSNETAVLVVTGVTAAALAPPFCIEPWEEDTSPLYDRPATGGAPGGKFATASCVLEATIPTKDEDWLDGKDEGSVETEADPAGASVMV